MNKDSKDSIIIMLILFVFGLGGFILIDKAIRDSLQIGDIVVLTVDSRLVTDWDSPKLVKPGCVGVKGNLYVIFNFDTVETGDRAIGTQQIAWVEPLRPQDKCSGSVYTDNLKKVGLKEELGE